MALDKVIDSAVLDANLTSVADAIRAKSGIAETLVFPGGFVSAVEGISAGGGGDDNIYYSLANGSLSGECVFEQEKITQCFRNLTSEHSLILNNAKTATGDRNFEYSNITSIQAPVLTNSTVYMFNACKKLVSAYFPELVGNAHHAFSDCSELKDVYVPKLQCTGHNEFLRCASLEFIDLPSAIFLDNTFTGCTSLKTVILRRTTVVTLKNVSAFNNTPFAEGGTGGTVYCPAALIEQYQQATNWSTLYAAGTCNFVAIEGSEYE